MRPITVLLITAALMQFSTVSAREPEAMTISVVEEHEKHLAINSGYALAWTLFEKAAVEAGIRLVAVESSWQASLGGVKSNKIDFVFGAHKTPDRDQWAAFSHPLYSEGSALFTVGENAPSAITNIDPIPGIVGVFTHSAKETRAISKSLGFEHVYSVAFRPTMYEMLRQKRLTYAYFGKAFAEYYCVYYSGLADKDCLVQIGATSKQHNRHVLTNRGNQQAVMALTAINAQLVSISGSKEAAALFTRFGKTPEQFTVWQQHFSEASKYPVQLNARLNL